MFHSLSHAEALFGTAAGALGVAGPACRSASGEEVDPRVAKVMNGTIGVDMHNHVYPAGTEPRRQGGPRGPAQEGPQGVPEARQGAAPPRQQEQQGPELSIAEEFKLSGLTAVCASYVLDSAPSINAGDARENYLRWLRPSMRN
jgi:hypothetical protein